MILKINTTGKKVELVNFLLSMAIDEAKKEHIRKAFELSLRDVQQIEQFRKQMLKSYFKKF